MAEDLTDYMNESMIKTKYMHSDIDAIERIELIKELRLGEFDVLIGINLLREGLDIPECGLVAILDADKEGFLRSKVSLIQTIGRAARNIEGRVILYADHKTKSIESAIDETDRRRLKQVEYNKKNKIIPKSTKRKIINILEIDKNNNNNIKKSKNNKLVGNNLLQHIKQLKLSMIENAENLNFEKAAEIRDEIKKLQKNEIGLINE
jgi:excinuclease ABC subunit B